MANSYLYKNQGTATNAKKFTYSVWIKRSKIASGTNQRFYQGWQSSDNRFYAFFVDTTGSDADKLWVYAVTGGTIQVYWVSNRRFRDTNAWYHIVFSADSTQASQDDRLKIYVNGVQETSWTKTNNPSQNIDWGNQITQSSGDLTISGTEGQTQLFEGYMSHVAFVDGQALAPTVFGETDSTSGIWKFKSPSGVTWGNTGYHLKMENSANLGLDSSGNTNNFTVGGNLKQAVDTPSNVYATVNALDPFSNSSFSNGNNTITTGTSEYAHTSTTLGASSGKYYCEIKHGSGNPRIGVAGKMAISTTDGLNGGAYEIYYENNGTLNVEGTSTSSWGATYTAGDIVGIGLDLDNNSGGSVTLSYNFGNGFFGTTAITSAGSNGNGSLFEYDVPSGFYALNTKNINTYG